MAAAQDLSGILHSTFGHREFRPHQQEVCEAAAAARDVLLVMPTGAGKSLCYQLPALALGGTALVISPLIAGMNLNESASSGQSSMQLKQTKHSLLRRSVCGSEAPSQFFRQRSQSTHLSTSRSILQSETEESVPRKAPT